jgi:hypothetical protein
VSKRCVCTAPTTRMPAHCSAAPALYDQGQQPLTETEWVYGVMRGVSVC